MVTLLTSSTMVNSYSAPGSAAAKGSQGMIQQQDQTHQVRLSKKANNSLLKLYYAIELYFLLIIIDIKLRRHSLKQVVHQLAGTYQNAARRSFAGPDEALFVEITQTLAHHVYNWHFISHRCLHQALVIYWFLARRGVKVDCIIAVRKYPFCAHAWSEWQGKPLTSPPLISSHYYKPILTLPVIIEDDLKVQKPGFALKEQLN